MHDRSDRRYLKRSLGLSAGLHLLALPLLVWLTAWGTNATLGSAHERSETATVSFLRIEHRTPPRRQPARARVPVAVVATEPKPAAVFVRPELAHRARVRTAGPSTPLAIAVRPLRTTTTAVVALSAAKPGVEPPTTVEATPTAMPSATPTPAPQPTVSASPAAIAEEKSVHGADLPPGGWGQSFEHPLIADDGALDDLRSRYHAVSRATIEVDDTGKPTHVTLPAGISDDLRAELERRLMDLRYVPAECNGLRCAGTLDLIL